MKLGLSKVGEKEQGRELLQEGEYEQSLADLYQVQLECAEAETDESERDESILNLLDVAETVEQHGMTEALNELVNEDNQLADLLGIDVSSYDDPQQCGQDVAQAIWNTVQEKDEDRDDIVLEDPEQQNTEGSNEQNQGETEGSTEAVDVIALAVVLGVLLGLEALFEKIINNTEKLLKKMDSMKSKLDDENLDEEGFQTLESKVNFAPAMKGTPFVLWPADMIGDQIKAMNNLGDYLWETVEKDNELDLSKLSKLIDAMGFETDFSEVDQQSGTMITFKSDATKHAEKTMGDLGYDLKSFRKAFGNVQESVEKAGSLAENIKEYTKKHKEKIKEQKQQKKEGDINKKQYKARKKELKTKKAVSKAVYRFYFGSAVNAGHVFVSVAKQIPTKSE